MRVRNKEHQSLGLKELKNLSCDYPDNEQLGKRVREIITEAEAIDCKETLTKRLSLYLV